MIHHDFSGLPNTIMKNIGETRNHKIRKNIKAILYHHPGQGATTVHGG